MLASAATAADDYPAKPVRMIVPFAPGGSADTVARIIAQPLIEQWGTQVVVDNRGGAGGSLGAQLAAAAAPDGYTLFQLNVANTIAVSLRKKLNFDPVKDFAHVTLLASSPFVLVASPSLNVKSLEEFLALARARPGQLGYGSSGIGGSSHLLTELLKTMARIDIVHVPYNGAPAMHADLMAGRIQVTFATPAATLAYVRAGKLRGLGISSKQRSAVAPGLPAIGESAVPGFEGGTWFGLVVPARTPNAIITKLHRDFVQILRRSEVQSRMRALGVEPGSGITPEEFSGFVRSEIEKWARIVAVSGATAN